MVVKADVTQLSDDGGKNNTMNHKVIDLKKDKVFQNSIPYNDALDYTERIIDKNDTETESEKIQDQRCSRLAVRDLRSGCPA
jgi:hypothetical protein